MHSDSSILEDSTFGKTKFIAFEFGFRIQYLVSRRAKNQQRFFVIEFNSYSAQSVYLATKATFSTKIINRFRQIVSDSFRKPNQS